MINDSCIITSFGRLLTLITISYDLGCVGFSEKCDAKLLKTFDIQHFSPIFFVILHAQI